MVGTFWLQMPQILEAIIANNWYMKKNKVIAIVIFSHFGLIESVLQNVMFYQEFQNLRGVCQKRKQCHRTLFKINDKFRQFSHVFIGFSCFFLIQW